MKFDYVGFKQMAQWMEEAEVEGRFDESYDPSTHPRFGEKHTKATRMKMSEAHKSRTVYTKGWYADPETARKRLSQAHKDFAASLTPEERSKHYNKNSNPTKNFGGTVECPHCGKTGQEAAMKRWHFDNCKGGN